ncbi:unnamed protein product [Prorocentrum cordatum]|uniref:Ornithine decarboxylase antizyme n=1 Tax=Prorocentrum cordatum TaxID=2364126 RepID=A0ABN9T099_9DINO|nr:unnamed protein product [Polarella glacialis]|mmetsp:Transcript_34436/g.92284  ORF Transcript_34436/g.92284 Transcript_34436/m.92284 type:complete len:185 (+) Transcript_34436:262-816(+)
MDGSIGPPPGGSPSGGGSHTQRSPPPSRRELAPYELWSRDEEAGAAVGFRCVHDVRRRVFYAKFEARNTEPDARGSDLERATKGAITTLLDVAEACRSRKITIGLGPEDAGSAELVCSLLYLGFQVVPSRKSPLVGTALLLDFDIGWPSFPGGTLSSDYTCTATSECSTSAEEDGLQDNGTDSS